MIKENEIVERIKKLLRLSESNPNPEEAASALEKAKELMKKHGVEADTKESKITAIIWESEWLSQLDTYSKNLVMATVELFDSGMFVTRSGPDNKYRIKVMIYGEPTDVALCCEVWPWLVSFGKKCAARSLGKGWSASHRSFMEGFGLRLYGRVFELRMAAEQKAKVIEGASENLDTKYALVIAKKEEAKEEILKQVGIVLHRPKARKIRAEYDIDALREGQKAAEQVDLNFRKNIR